MPSLCNRIIGIKYKHAIRLGDLHGDDPLVPCGLPLLLKSVAIKPFLCILFKVSFLGKGRRDEQKDDYC